MNDLPTLTQQWEIAKQNLSHAQDQLLAVESAIYELVQNDLPEKGTKSFDTGLKIVTGYTESWDQPVLNAAHQQWPQGIAFPFEGQWKAKGKDVTYIRENHPDAYSLIRPALTLKPKKPAFSVKE